MRAFVDREFVALTLALVAALAIAHWAAAYGREVRRNHEQRRSEFEQRCAQHWPVDLCRQVEVRQQ